MSINPFTAMMSLEKGPIKVQKFKSLGLFLFFFAIACERILSKHTVFKVDLLYDQKIYRLQAYVHELFSP